MELLILISAVAVLLAALGVAVAARRARWPEARLAADGVQDMTIHVEGSYRPPSFAARAGVPLRLHFVRDEDNACSDRVFIPDFSIEKWLPAHRATTIELLPEWRGEFLFTCRNGIYIGLMKVRERRSLRQLLTLGRLFGAPASAARIRKSTGAPDGTGSGV